MKAIWIICFFIFSMGVYAQSLEVYDQLLSKYVSISGKVNYEGFISERNEFEAFLNWYGANPPSQSANREDSLAYWINVYNAFTIKLIVDNYPIETITKLHPFFYFPGVNTVWHEEFFQIAGEDFSLDKVEHEILRPQFKDARIHFAINCASISCPILRNEAYEPDDLENQLEDQSRLFLNDESRNIISENELQLSKIFKWFESDFGSKEEIIDFINKYTINSVNYNARISYLPYNWSLND